MEELLQKIQEEEKKLNKDLENWRNEKRALSLRKEERCVCVCVRTCVCVCVRVCVVICV